MREEPFFRRRPDGSGGTKAVRKIITLLLLAASLLAGSPVRAESFNGTIMLPDFGTPSAGRLMYTQSGGAINGIVGYVFKLGAKSNFTLRETGGMTGIESFDIFFYDEQNGMPGNSLEPVYNRCPAQELFCDKAGPIPAGAKWAVITLVLGANGTFRYTAG